MRLDVWQHNFFINDDAFPFRSNDGGEAKRKLKKGKRRTFFFCVWHAKLPLQEMNERVEL